MVDRTYRFIQNANLMEPEDSAISDAPPGGGAAMVPRVRAPKREIFGWAMFDFANQAYTLLIITVIFSDLFTHIIVGDRGDGARLANFLWGLALAISYGLVVLAAPVFGAMMDYWAAKKRFLFASYLLTVVSTCALYFGAPGWIVLTMALIVLSNFAYAIGESFIASFLPDLGPPEDQGRISGFGWALGYVGGLVATAFALIVLGEVTAENFERIRWVGPFAGLFFLVSAVPTFVWLRERGVRHVLPPGTGYVALGLGRLRATLGERGRFRDLGVLLLSVFFTMAGIYIIISFTFIYGRQVIGWDDHIRIYMFVIVQITAAVGAIVFGVLQDRIGAKPIYLLSLSLWILAILAIYATPWLASWCEARFGLGWEAQHIFLLVGCLAGASLGSSQSAGRALVGVLAPKAKAGEFFGLWGLATKLGAIFGILGLALLQSRFGLQTSILFCAVLFACALAACLFVNQTRGRAVAERYGSEVRGAIPDGS